MDDTELGRRVMCYLTQRPIKGKALVIDVRDMAKYDPMLANMFIEEYDRIIKEIRFSANEFGEGLEPNYEVRIKNLPESETWSIHEVRDKHLGMLINVKGLIRSVTNVKNKIQSVEYMCNSCMKVKVYKNKITKCAYCNAPAQELRINKMTGKDYVYLVLEEDSKDLDANTDPKTIICLLEKDLCDPKYTQKFRAGTKVKITGTVRTKESRDKKEEGRYYYIDTNYIDFVDESIDSYKFGVDKVLKFKEIKDPIHTIGSKIFYDIYGNDEIKTSLLLQLVSAKPHRKSRGNIHILLVGDPGCLSKGTMVATPFGNRKIEETSLVYSYDFKKEKVIANKCYIIPTKKQAVEIEFEDGEIIKCSKEHPFFLGTQAIKAKDLNIGDLLDVYDIKKMHNMWKRDETLSESIEYKKVLFNEMPFYLQKGTFVDGEAVWCNEQAVERTNNNQRRSGRVIHKSEAFSYRNWDVKGNRQACNKKEINYDGYYHTKLQRASCNCSKKARDERVKKNSDVWNWKSILQAWKMLWTNYKQKQIFRDSEKEPAMGMYSLQEKEDKPIFRFSCPSFRWKQYEQFSRKLNSTLSKLSCEATQFKRVKAIRYSTEDEEMFDLVVPGTNNFFLANGMLTHNTGKTKISKEVISYLPGSRFSSAVTASGVGLIASTEKNEEIGGYMLKYGALPMSNKSMIAIDEFEKLDKRNQTMLNNAMEDMKVHIDKASIHETIETDVSVLAIANPKDRTFNPFEPAYSQININKELIDRFDLVFALKAPKTKEEMMKISRTIQFAEDVNPLPKKFLVEYLIYARNFIKPEITEDIANKIIDKYLEICKPASDENNPGMYCSARAQNSLTRLCIASAKLRLSEQVEEQDIELASQLMTKSLESLGVVTETGEIDSFTIEKSTKISTRERMKIILELLDKDMMSEEDIISTINCTQIEFDEAISKLKADVYEPKRGFWKRL